MTLDEQAEEVARNALKVKPGDHVSERQWVLALDTAKFVLGLLQGGDAQTTPKSSESPAKQGVEGDAQTAPPRQSARTVAKLKGYTGDTCSECGDLSMVRNGTCLKCDVCGATTGCS